MIFHGKGKGKFFKDIKSNASTATSVPE